MQLSDHNLHPPCRLRHLRSGGFTFVELCLALLITTLIVSAISAFSLAMARSWEMSGRSQLLSISAAQVTMRLQNDLRDAKRLGACRSGWLEPSSAATAAVVVWRADTNSDRRIQSTELQVLVHDAEQRVLKRLRTPAGASPIEISRTTFDGAGIFEVMADLATDVQVIAREVAGARFHALPGDEETIKPSLQFILKFQKQKLEGDQPVNDGASLFEFGTATLRGPAHADDPIS